MVKKMVVMCLTVLSIKLWHQFAEIIQELVSLLQLFQAYLVTHKNTYGCYQHSIMDEVLVWEDTFQHSCRVMEKPITVFCSFEPRKNSFPLFSVFNHKFNNDLVTPRQTECIQSITNPFTRSKGLNSKNTEAPLIPLTGFPV